MNSADVLFEARRDFQQTERRALAIAVADSIQQPLVFRRLPREDR